jgi:hypothetical protein
MASRFDGPSILAAIGNDPSAFPALKADIDATARKLLTKQLKAASLSIETLGRMLSTIGEGGIRIGFDEISPKDLATIARRLDPANHSLAEADGAGLRDHICGLGRGDVAPTPGKKVAMRPTAKKKKTVAPKIGEVLNSKVYSGLPPESVKKPARPRTPKT